MNRRRYLAIAATGSLLGVAGCTDDDTGQQYPPYPDSESTDLSGSGDTVTETFDLMSGGPMILDVQHEGDGRFVAFVVDENENFVQSGPTVQAVGPYRGSSVHGISAGTYSLEIEASGDWTATVHDLPVYDDGTGLSLPIEQDGGLGGVIGPIDFGTQSSKQFSVEFDSSQGLNRVELIDREGEPVGALFGGRELDAPEGETDTEDDSSTENETDSETNETDGELNETDGDTNETDTETDGDTNETDSETDETTAETETTLSVDIGGVGYLSIESLNQWSISLSEQ